MRERLRAIIREFYAQAREGEPTRDVFLKAKRLVKKELVMSEQNQNGTVTVEAVEQKKRGGRRKAAEGGPVRRKAASVAPVQVVTLTPAQVCNLWRAAMGGELVIEQDPTGRIVCKVSFSSFEKALPVILEQLK